MRKSHHLLLNWPNKGLTVNPQTFPTETHSFYRLLFFLNSLKERLIYTMIILQRFSSRVLTFTYFVEMALEQLNRQPRCSHILLTTWLLLKVYLDLVLQSQYQQLMLILVVGLLSVTEIKRLFGNVYYGLTDVDASCKVGCFLRSRYCGRDR